MRDLIVYVQMATMLALAVYFCHDGLYRLSAAQLGYTIITAILFVGVKEAA